MKKEIFIHVGMHKTGSSSIQASLNKYHANGIRYADLGFVNHSQPLLTAFLENPERYHIHIKNGRSKDQIRAIKEKTLLLLLRELNRPDCEKIIISGEGLSSLSFKELIVFKEILSKFTEKITVIAYIRDPVSYMSSDFQESVKGGYSGSELPLPYYREKFEKFLRVFGRKNINFRLFDRRSLVNSSVVSDFCELVNIPYASVVEKAFNESISLDAVRLMYLFNKKGIMSLGDEKLLKARRKMVTLISEVSNEKFLIPENICQAYIDVPDVQWMEQQTGFSLYKHGSAPVFVKKQSASEWLESFMNSHPKHAVDFLRSLLRKNQWNVTPGDDILILLNKIYCYSLASGGVSALDNYVGGLMNIFDSLKRSPDVHHESMILLLDLALCIRPDGKILQKKRSDFLKKQSNNI
ncbi:MAG: hypothetical protein PHF42_08430 [Pseudomonas sp.]|nr:hypothetical protein [Pseudomonas sp.]